MSEECTICCNYVDLGILERDYEYYVNCLRSEYIIVKNDDIGIDIT